MNSCKQNHTFYFVFLFLFAFVISEAQQTEPECNHYSRQVCETLRRFKRFVRMRSIVGGTRANPKEFPHMARIGYEMNGVEWRCGGSLISENFVLTAAHCARPRLMNTPTPTWIRLGELNLDDISEHATRDDYKITEIFIHPKYIRWTYDIALLKFQGLSEFTAYIRPVCLHVYEEIPTRKVTAQGWGSTQYQGHMSRKLRTVDLDLENDEKCNSLHKFYDDRINICAGYAPGGKGTCYGDSGGPVLFLENRIRCSEVPIYKQVGITSYAKGCAFPNIPNVYSKVSYFIPWIESIVWNNTYKNNQTTSLP